MAGKNRELKDENEKLRDENKELRRRMDGLEEKMRNLKGEIVEETITQVMRRLKEDESKKQDETINRAAESNDIKKEVNKYISNAREEDKDKEWRKNNLIVLNANESRKETLTSKNEDDEAECQFFFVKIGVEDYIVEHMFRRRRPSDNGKHRPLLVILSTEKEKFKILGRAKRLKNTTGQMGKVYINRDMSKKERARDYKLRTMLAEREGAGK